MERFLELLSNYIAFDVNHFTFYSKIRVYFNFSPKKCEIFTTNRRHALQQKLAKKTTQN